MTVLNSISLLPLAVLLTMAPASLVSQMTDSSQSQHTVRGEVINSVTHEPIADALVNLGDEHVAFTDHEGQFELDNMPGGSGFPSAEKPGYFPQRRASGDATPLTAENQPITLELVPEAILSGTVIDQEGRPLEGLPVHLKNLQVFNGLRSWQQTMSTATNAEGEFRFAELQAGKYTLATGFQTDGVHDSSSSVAYVPVVYPAASGSEQAALTLAAGDHIEASLTPPMEKLYEVHGRIENRVAGVNVEVETSNGSPIDPTFRFNSATGEFLLLLPGGGYRLKFHTYDTPVPLLGTREISINGSSVSGVSVTLAPLATIPVEVEHQIIRTYSADKAPPAPGYWNLALEEVSPGGLPHQFVAGPPPNAAPGDAQVIRNLEPGHYRLQVNTVGPWYLASAYCGGIDLTRELLTIAGGAAGCTMHMMLRDDFASLHWSLGTNGQSQSEPIYVYTIPLDNLAQAIANPGVQTGSAGLTQGSIEGLAPGRYLVIAFDREQNLAYKETDTLQKYSSLGKEVILTAGGISEVQLDLVHEPMENGEE